MLFCVVSHCTTGVIAVLSGTGTGSLLYGFSQIADCNGVNRTVLADAMAATAEVHLLQHIIVTQLQRKQCPVR